MMLRAAGGNCSITIGPSSRIGKYARGRRLVTITDERVMRLHPGKIPGRDVVVIGRGEGAKTMATVERIFARFSELEVDRSAIVVGMGGGVVCDLAGFAAATYHRGLDLALAPTTLLAQADAAIGGKSGVNLRGYKNLVGTIRQPKMVVCDAAFLDTLGKEDMGNGLAEVVKHGAIASLPLLKFAGDNSRAILAREPPALRRIISDSIKIKCAIVQRDEGDSGERMKLNFGHTIGHALEKVCGLTHGKAIGIGMAVECEIAVSMGMAPQEDSERLAGILKRLGLPSAMPDADAGEIIDAIFQDKKRRGDGLMMPVLDGLGKCKVRRVRLNDLREALDEIR